MRSVSRSARLMDLAGLALFLAGVGLAGRAWVGFRGLPEFQPAAGGPAWEAVQMADGFLRLQRVGVGLMVAGLAVFVAAWWTARRSRAANAVADGAADEPPGRSRASADS